MVATLQEARAQHAVGLIKKYKVYLDLKLRPNNRFQPPSVKPGKLVKTYVYVPNSWSMSFTKMQLDCYPKAVREEILKEALENPKDSRLRFWVQHVFIRKIAVTECGYTRADEAAYKQLKLAIGAGSVAETPDD